MSGVRVWHNDNSIRPRIAAVTETDFYLIAPWPWAYRRVLESLRSGVDPSSAGGVRVPLDRMIGVMWDADDWALHVHFRGSGDKAGKPTAIGAMMGESGAEVVEELRGVLDVAEEPVRVPVSVGRITFGPAVVGLCAAAMGVLGWIGLHAGPAQGEVRGKARVMKMLVESLGPTGTVALFGGVTALAAAYWLYRFVRRPTAPMYRVRGVR